jgi:uncharacterized protein (DUF427 family)
MSSTAAILAVMRPSRTIPGPGQESVWDYPRPPRVEPVPVRLRVELGGTVVADTTAGVRVLETSHPPVYYLPLADTAPGALEPAEGRTFCEFKGVASYWTVRGGAGRVEVAAAWGYPSPVAGFEALAGRVAFYPARMDACWVGDERAEPQPGGFYGGWVTSTVVGPFKGGPGSSGW